MEIVFTRGPWTPDSAAEILLVVGAALAVHLAVFAIAMLVTRRHRAFLRAHGSGMFKPLPLPRR